MKTKIEISTWKRKDQFNLFSAFDHPYLTISAHVDCTSLHKHCKENNISFFIAYIYISNLVTNQISEFKLRIEDDGVYEYDMIHPSPTIARQDDTFGFAYFNTNHIFKEFYSTTVVEIDRIKNLNNLELKPDKNLIYYSVLPKLNFTAIQHPEIHSKSLSIPKIVFGKYELVNDRLKMPISISANHALVDGFHISKYFELFQNYLDDCQTLIKL